MHNKKIAERALCLVALVCAVLLYGAPQRALAQDVRFYMKFSGANIRNAPSVVAPILTPIGFDALYPVLGRTVDNTWLKVQVGDQVGWLPAGFGEVQGDLNHLPTVPLALAASVRNANRSPLPAHMRTTARGKALLQAALKAGRDPRMFTIAGDSNAAWGLVPGLLVGGQINISARYPTLRGTIARYDGALVRQSIAVGGGFRAADMFDPAFDRKPSTCAPTKACICASYARAGLALCLSNWARAIVLCGVILRQPCDA